MVAARVRLSFVGAASMLVLLSAGTLAVAGGASPAAQRKTMEEAKVELGRRLFFDPAASRLGVHSCADCHSPEHGFSDPERTSHDDAGPTKRHSQTLIDVGDSPSAHWDGEFPSVKDLVLARLGQRRSGSSGSSYDPGNSGGIALRQEAAGGNGGQVRILQRAMRLGAQRAIETGGRYSEGFEAAFRNSRPTVEGISDAMVAYCHSIQSGTSAYDRYVAGDPKALSDVARRGLELFRGRAGCAVCHKMDGDRAKFTDYLFHDTGVSWSAVLARRAPLPGDPGRMDSTHATRDLRSFKTPTLRDVARRGPYMHDASATTLEDAVRYYLSGAIKDPTIDPRMPTMVASDADVAEIVAFLKALSSEERPGLSTTAWSLRPPTTRLRFIDAAGYALGRRPVTLAPDGDVVPGGRGATLTLVTDLDGWVEYAPPCATHMRVVLDGDLAPEAGSLIPDVCRSAVLKLPVGGTTRLRVLLPAGATPPATIVAEHVQVALLPEERFPRTVFRLTGAAAVLDGRTAAVYEGDFRTDVPPVVRVHVPLGPVRARIPATLERDGIATIDPSGPDPVVPGATRPSPAAPAVRTR